MTHISIIRHGDKEHYQIGSRRILRGDKVQARLRDDEGKWMTFAGDVVTAADLNITHKSFAEELWVTIPGFHDFAVHYLHGSATDVRFV